MRIVWATVVAILCLWIGGRPISAAILKQSAPSGSGQGVTDRDFVYAPKPTPLLVTDPRFHREGFQVSAESAKSSQDILLQPAVSAIPTARPAAPLPATATPAPIILPPATPLPTQVESSVVTVSPGASLTRTPFVIANDAKPLYQPALYDFKASDFRASDFRASSVSMQSAFAATTVPAQAQAAAALTRTPVIMPAATATPSPVTAHTAQPIVIATRDYGDEVDIEDPRFYRGSFTIAPSLSLQGGAPSKTVTDASTPGYGGYSADTISPSYAERTPLPVGGKAMYYNPGIMHEVYAYRLKLGQVQPCAECVGFVALLRKGDLNRRVWLQWGSGAIEGPFLVIDVAARQHIGLLLGRGWAVDVDYQTAMRHGMAGPVPVTILDAPAFAN